MTARFTRALFSAGSSAKTRARLHPGHGFNRNGWNEGLAHLRGAQAWQPGAAGASMSITGWGLLPFAAHNSAAAADD
jgi:hypothetical protein